MIIDVTRIIIALLGAATTGVITMLIPWVKSRTTTSQQAIIVALARTAVYAA